MSINTEVMGLKKPTLNDKKGDTISELAANFDIIAGLFPIGSIYQSTKNVNPGTFIANTTWSPIRGRMLISESEEFPINTTGGAKEVTLTVEQLPAHNHGLPPRPPWYSAEITETGDSILGSSSSIKGRTEYNTWYTGGNKAHNNMPPYKSVYMWERTA